MERQGNRRGPLLRGSFTPAYLLLKREGFREKAALALEVLRQCTVCPRLCGVDRTAGEAGYCGVLDMPMVSSWGPHYGEERPISGARGSGAIFFGGCNLRCVFCQNWRISQGGDSAEVDTARLAGIMLALQREGCHNINLVSPSHQAPMMLQALLMAAEGGLTLPVVYNTGGYDSLDTLGLLEGVVDIYMPDLKYADPALAAGLSDAPDYPQRAMEAIREMHRQVGDLRIDPQGVAQRGLLIRHLVLPGGLAGTADVLRFIATEISKDTYVNIMDQYRPCYRAFGRPPLDRGISEEEYEEALRQARTLGLRRLDGVS